ncbi:MAG: deaminase [Chloroflexi bacterium]|nr:deaminase [Chloroflexota bacterium]
MMRPLLQSGLRTSFEREMVTMAELVCELIVSLDGYARGQRSPGYYGYFGPDFDHWIKTNTAIEHRIIIGRKTYEIMNAIPAQVRDEGWKIMQVTPGWLFSRTLESTDWPGLKVVRDDMVGFLREQKQVDGPELRTLGSVSLVKQLLTAGLVDRLKLVICPLILPETGAEPIFNGLPDTGFELVSNEVLDGRVLLVEYRPAGTPPYVA